MQIQILGSLTALCASSFLLAHAGQDEDAAKQVSLTIFTPKQWEFLLPDEEWFAINGPIFIGAHEFATKADSESQIFIATTAGQTPTTGVPVRGEILKLGDQSKDGERFDYAIRVRGAAGGGFEWSPAGVRTGTIEGVKVTLFDKNGNGVFNDVGLDAIGVGNRAGAALFGRVLRVGTTLLEYEVDADGSAIRWTPYMGAVGSLDIASQFGLKAKLDSAVFSSSDSQFSFDLSDAQGPVQVPVGTYELSYAHVTKGTGSAHVARGKMDTLPVTQESGAQLTWGGELFGEPVVRRGTDEITITPQYRIFGNGGEEYYDFTPDPAPQRWAISEVKSDKRLKQGSLPTG